MSETRWQEALDGITGNTWADDLARMSVLAAQAKFSPNTPLSGHLDRDAHGVTAAEGAFSVTLREDALDGGWVAECPDLPGCFARGDTQREALRNINDAIAGIISLRAEQDTRPAISGATPSQTAPAGTLYALSGHGADDTHEGVAAEGTVSPQATSEANPSTNPPAGSTNSHGQPSRDAQAVPAVAASSPQASMGTITNPHSPAGSTNGHGHSISVNQDQAAVTASVPGDHTDHASQRMVVAGDSAGQPAANGPAMPIPDSLLADPLLALAADVLDDLEKIRIANENRYRQLTRTGTDADGEERGFGLDESHPDVARLAALVAMLSAAEHQAELNLARLMRGHPLGPWVKATAGIGEKQGARLLAAIGDPYIRPEITRADGTVEPSRPRLVSELWAYAGYHVIRTPVSGHTTDDAHGLCAADGSASGQGEFGTHFANAGNGGHPGQKPVDGHVMRAGVAAKPGSDVGQRCADPQDAHAGIAPRRKRGEHANWSAAAKMRAYLVAVSCMKHLDSPYRPVYDAARAKYADAVHQVACARCGPAGKPAPPGSPLSDGHKHARALRAVAKEILRDLWLEARRIHGAPAPRGGAS